MKASSLTFIVYTCPNCLSENYRKNGCKTIASDIYARTVVSTIPLFQHKELMLSIFA